jgi:Ran GTPase-activating protein (RanGAP) involved in mRNA processing and transport
MASSVVDLDSIIGNHMNEGLYEEEEKKYTQCDVQDGRGRRNAIVGGGSNTVEIGDETFFFTGIDSTVEGGIVEAISSKSTEQLLKDYPILPVGDDKSSHKSTTVDEISKLNFNQRSNLDVNSQILMKNMDYADILSGKHGKEHLIPGGLSMSQAVTKKYFGVQARHHFFEQLQFMQQKRQIYGTTSDVSTPADLNHSISLASPNKGTALEKSLEDMPFKIDRPPKALRVNTRVIIRTQGIGIDEAYEQMKLIQKPKNLVIDEQGGSSTDSDDDHSYINTSSFPLPLGLDNRQMNKKESPLIAKSPQGQKGKPPPNNLKLKPITTGKVQNSISSSSLPGILSGGSSGANSARSSDSTRSNNKKLSPVQMGEEAEIRSANKQNGKQKTNLKVSMPSESKYKQRHLQAIKEQGDTSSVSYLAELYKEHLFVTKVEEENRSLAKKKSKEKGELDENSNLPDMELVCIDHRDPLNKKIMDNLHKKSSLFKYVEAKTAKKDFYDLSDNSDDSDGEGEIFLWSQQSPLSPSHIIPVLSPISKNSRNSKTHPIPRRRENKSENAPVKPTDQVALSPRSKFIDSCIRKKLNPRASLILRKTFTKELNLKHLGMGDELAVLLADALTSIPYIQSLNICDNNLGDKGLSAIVGAVSDMADLVELNMSMNDIGPNAAQALNNYLIKENCPLITLILRKADVDDDECRDFVQALEHNRNLTTLDLSENLVGSSENLNTVMPELVTGGEALADLLSSPNCPLTTLKLGWNMIRLDGAAALCGALAINRSLTYLELSFNSLGASGGVALGDALQENKVLKTLLVGNNSLDSIACLTICAGILENEALRDLSFDGNPIGEQGAKALMVSFPISYIYLLT